jgi:hypothetical protein
MVSVWVDTTLDWDAIAGLLHRSYRLVAIRRMLSALDETWRKI